jgi:hypothetical protein
VQVAHSCNSSYSGGKDQEDHSLKPAQGNSSQDPISKKKRSITKKGLVEWLKVEALSSNTCTVKKKKKVIPIWVWWLTPVFVAIQEQRLGVWWFEVSLGKQFARSHLSHQKAGLGVYVSVILATQKV